MADMRVCTVCGGSEPDVRFSGTHRKCNRCRAKAVDPEQQREYQRRRRAKNPEYGAERTRKYREDNPHMAFYTTSRHLAKKAGAPCTLTQEDAEDIHEMPNVCAYCGKDSGPEPSPRAVHIDHIIPMVQGGPNSRWNLTKVCNSCNASKGSASVLDFHARTPEFTDERYEAVIAEMVRLSGYSAERIAELLAQSHAFEIAHQAERARMADLLAA